MKKKAEWVGGKKKFLYMYIFNVFIKNLCNVVGKQGDVTNWGFQFFFARFMTLSTNHVKLSHERTTLFQI